MTTPRLFIFRQFSSTDPASPRLSTPQKNKQSTQIKTNIKIWRITPKNSSISCSLSIAQRSKSPTLSVGSLLSRQNAFEEPTCDRKERFCREENKAAFRSTLQCLSGPFRTDSTRRTHHRPHARDHTEHPLVSIAQDIGDNRSGFAAVESRSIHARSIS